MKLTKISTGVIKNPKNSVVGMASVEIDDCIVLKNIKIINGKNGLFLGMPTTKQGDEYKDVFYFKNKKAIEYITKKVVEEFEIKKIENNPKNSKALTEVDNDGDVPF